MSDSASKQFPNSLGLTVSDMKASLAFYCDQIGFELKESWPSADDAKWASLSLGGQVIMLGEAMDADACAQMHASSPEAGRFWGEQAARFAGQPHGVGVNCYIAVEDVDAFAAEIQERGLRPHLPPTSQFYGIRDTVLTDPDGYVLTFYTTITMQSCQSCGMPLSDARPGQMYCQHCVDEDGQLHPFEQILAGAVNGYFIPHLKMERSAAEQAAREHLAKMPAWISRA